MALGGGGLELCTIHVCDLSQGPCTFAVQSYQSAFVACQGMERQHQGSQRAGAHHLMSVVLPFGCCLLLLEHSHAFQKHLLPALCCRGWARGDMAARGGGSPP